MSPSLRPEHVLAAILSSTEDALVSIALDGTIQSWSEGAVRLYGYSAAEMIGQPLARILPLHDVPYFKEFLNNMLKEDFACFEDAERLRKDGTGIRVTLRRGEVRDAHGEIAGVLEIARMQGCDVEGPAPDAEVRRVLEQTPAILWTTDRALRITSNWGAGLAKAKIKPGALVGQTVNEYLRCEDPQAAPIAQHVQALSGVSSHFEYRHQNRDFEIHLGPLRGPGGEIVGCIGAGIDVTDRKKNEDEVRHQATHDALTGLANYGGFVDTLEREVRRAERIQHSFALLLLDLDELKRINDQFGHLAGNRALKRLSDVIQEHCRATDVAARYGGDEFAVVLIDADPGIARQIADRVDHALRGQSEQPALSVSIGISVYPADGRTAQELLETADKHLYMRKKVFRSQSVTTR
jgi:diguanylate cyclase (GGDEF)-like protein/PAS domain S-box-containing protein